MNFLFPFVEKQASTLCQEHLLPMSCPCCGKAGENIFLYQPYVLQPLALQWLEEDTEVNVQEEEGAISFLGRYFIQADIPLPLSRRDSPVAPRVWIEVIEEVFYSLLAVHSGEKNRLSAWGNLACDVPGFPGSIGAPVRFRILSSVKEVEIISCLDRRVATMKDDMDHDEMVVLYRKTWGNFGHIPRVSMKRREKISSAWEEYLDTSLFARRAEPPPQLAGLPPGQVLLAPPLDTNECAVFCTVGCSDVRQEGGTLVEIASWVRNPPDDFIRCFGEFAYLSHLNPKMVVPGAVIPEQNPIPGSNGRMAGWVLALPWWEDEDYLPVEDEGVQVLAALPLLATEIRYAALFGVDDLLQELQNSDLDIYNLLRDAVVSIRE